jgi:hypothetical protein
MPVDFTMTSSASTGSAVKHAAANRFSPATTIAMPASASIGRRKSPEVVDPDADVENRQRRAAKAKQRHKQKAPYVLDDSKIA